MGNQGGVIVPVVDLQLKPSLANATLDGTTEAQRVQGKEVDFAPVSTLKNKAQAVKVTKKPLAAGSEQAAFAARSLRSITGEIHESSSIRSSGLFK